MTVKIQLLIFFTRSLMEVARKQTTIEPPKVDTTGVALLAPRSHFTQLVALERQMDSGAAVSETEELEKAIRTDLATYSSDIAIHAVDGGQYDLGDEIGTVSVGLVRGVRVQLDYTSLVF